MGPLDVPFLKFSEGKVFPQIYLVGQVILVFHIQTEFVDSANHPNVQALIVDAI